jgi:integrase
VPRKAKELTALVVSRIKTPGHHAVGGVSGLTLYVTDSGTCSWVLRTMVGSKRRHMGLGGFPDVSLAEAKEKARSAKKSISQGIDPIAQRKAAANQLRAQQAREITFEQATKEMLEVRSDNWKNPKHRAQWSSTLTTYAFPHLGKMLVQDITQADILKVLEPIWRQITETASRVRGRIESVLDWATAKGHRTGENPALWAGRLDQLLPAPTKLKKQEHYKALPFAEMSAFMVDLRKREGLAARALEFAILCASRSGEVRGAVWPEINLTTAIWTIPAERMKAGKIHRVPLSPSACALLKALPRLKDNPLVFPAPQGGELSDMSLSAVMRRMKIDAVPHGFRSTFRDWVGEHTNYPKELAELALAHVLPNKVEAAYSRGDALDKRRAVMEAWDKSISPPLLTKSTAQSVRAKISLHKPSMVDLFKDSEMSSVFGLKVNGKIAK